MKTTATCVGCVLILGIVLGLFGGCSSGPDASAKSTATENPPATKKAVVPLLPKTEIADWCGEHGVPESICTRCNTKLIADFKGKGDWCDAHGLPKSQCLACDPALKAKLDALRPAAK